MSHDVDFFATFHSPGTRNASISLRHRSDTKMAFLTEVTVQYVHLEWRNIGWYLRAKHTAMFSRRPDVDLADELCLFALVGVQVESKPTEVWPSFQLA